MARRPAFSIALSGCCFRSFTGARFRFDNGQIVSVVRSRGEAIDQRGVLERTVAVIEAVDVQQVKRFVDIFGRAFLAGVGDELEAALPAPCDRHVLELRGRVALLR